MKGVFLGTYFLFYKRKFKLYNGKWYYLSCVSTADFAPFEEYKFYNFLGIFQWRWVLPWPIFILSEWPAFRGCHSAGGDRVGRKMLLKGRFCWQITHKEWLCPLQKFKESLVLHTQLRGGAVTILGFSDPIISVAVGWNGTSETLERLQETQWERGIGIRVKKWWCSIAPPDFAPYRSGAAPLKWWIPVDPSPGWDWGCSLQCSGSSGVLLIHFWQWEMPEHCRSTRMLSTYRPACSQCSASFFLLAFKHKAFYLSILN